MCRQKVQKNREKHFCTSHQLFLFFRKNEKKIFMISIFLLMASRASHTHEVK
jgi:hypothetical protein